MFTAINIQPIIDYDRNVTSIIYHIIPHTLFLDKFFAFLSLLGNSFFLWLAILAIIMYFEERRDKRFIVYFMVAFLATGIFVNIILKKTFHRPRPPVPLVQTVTYTCPKDFSFPSGHAAAAFSSAVVLSAFDKKRKYHYYFIAFLISLSRIYLGCHFFLDTIVGGMVGSIISLMVLRFGIRTENAMEQPLTTTQKKIKKSIDK